MTLLLAIAISAAPMHSRYTAENPAASLGPDSPRYAAEAQRVTIIQDNYGVPHIYGKTDADVVFGLMYTECALDFPRVEKNYLEVMGRQAEAYGPDYLKEDLELQLIEDTADAKRDYQNAPTWLHQLLDAFADGVNYYLLKHPDCKPLVLKHFEPWFPLMFTDGSVSATSTGGIKPQQPWDYYGLETNAPTLGALDGHAGPAPETAFRSDFAGEALETGSNGFAIAPSLNVHGHAMLYINPHVPFYFRLEAQLVSEEGLNTYGAITWGQFFIYQGFNAHCGWMHTSSYADVADLYKEKLDHTAGKYYYLRDGHWFEAKQKILRLRSLKDGVLTTTRDIEAIYTDHGPVMDEEQGYYISLKEYNRSMKALEEAWLITKANTFAQYKQAMDLRANTTNNTVYADDQGNIAYWHGNFMPRRNPALDWSLPVDGTVSTTQWGPPISPDSIVHVFNPTNGWIQNCNSTPFSVAGVNSPKAEDYPGYMAPDGENYRAVNAVRLLSKARHLNLDSLIAIGYNHYLAAFEAFLPPLLKALDSLPDQDTLKQVLSGPVNRLRSWNRTASDTSVATTLAIEWGSRVYRRATPAPTTELSTHALDMVASAVHNTSGSDLLYYLDTVINTLRLHNGTWNVPWGSLNRYQRLTGKINETYDDHQASLPVGFAPSTFGSLPSFQSRYMPGTTKRYGYSGNSFIAAIEFGPRVIARTIATGGNSSDPHSPHFTDQASGYIDGKLKDVYFYKEDVLHHVEKKYHPGEE